MTGFAIVRDTREQKPWDFAADVAIVDAALPAGDYAPLGAETRCAVERKSLADWIGSITWERERFKRELAKLKSYEFAAVVIEANMADVYAREYRSQVHPNAVLGSAIAVTLDFCPVIWAGNREHGANLCARLLRRFWDKRVNVEVEAA